MSKLKLSVWERQKSIMRRESATMLKWASVTVFSLMLSSPVYAISNNNSLVTNSMTAVAADVCTAQTKISTCAKLKGSVGVVAGVGTPSTYSIDELAFVRDSGSISGITPSFFPSNGVPSLGSGAVNSTSLACYVLDANAGAAGTLNYSCEMSSLACNALYRYHFAGSHTTAGAVEHSNTNTTATSMSFYTTACTPSAGTLATSTQSTASVTVSVPKGALAQTVVAEYGATTAYGSNATMTGGTVTSGSGSSTVTASMTGLTCGTTYHIRFNTTTDDGAVNGSTTINGTDGTFSTSPCGPIPTTGAASNVDRTTADLAGTVDDNTYNTTAIVFEYGLTTAYGSQVNATPNTLTAGTGVTNVSASLTGLTCGSVTYHYRLNATGNSVTVNGADQTFTTSATCNATVTPLAATPAQYGGTLNGTVNDNGQNVTSIYYQIGTTTAYGTTVAASPSTLAASSGLTNVSGAATGLACKTLYHYRLNAVTGLGTVNSSDMTFTTGECPVNGSCGTLSGTVSRTAPAATGSFCSSGTASGVAESGSGWSWTCTGLYNGSNAACQVYRQVDLPTGGASASVMNGMTVDVSSNNKDGSTISVPAGSATFNVNLGQNNQVQVTTAGGSTNNTEVKFSAVNINGQSYPAIKAVTGEITITTNTGNSVVLAVGQQAILSCDDKSQTQLAMQSSNTSAGANVGVVSGCLILPANTIVDGNRFSGITGNKVLAGEAVFIDPTDKVTRVRLGTAGDNSTKLGDKLPLESLNVAVGFNDVKSPRLDGASVRLGGTATLLERLQTELGITYAPNTYGVFTLPLHVAYGGPQSVNFANFRAVGDILVNTDLPKGWTRFANDTYRYSTGGVQTLFAPSVIEPYRLLTQLRLANPDATEGTALTSGAYRLKLKGGVLNGGTEYVLRPSWMSYATSSVGLTGWGTSNPRYNDGKQSVPLLPYPADLDTLTSLARGVDASSTLQITADDGVLTVVLQGITHRLMPVMTLQMPPAEQAGKPWWYDSNGDLVVRNADGTAQAFKLLK